MKTCKFCAGPIQRKSSGPWPTYCSPPCKSKAAHERAKADGRYQEWLQRDLAQRQAQREANAHPCRYCQTPMTNIRRVQCGAPDCERKHNAANQRRQQLKHKAETGQWLSDKYRVAHNCVQCGKTWETRRDAKYCSNACQAAHQYGPQRNIKSEAPPTWYRKLHRKVAKAARGTQGTRPWVVGHCARCGQDFVVALISDIPRYCSSRCKTREAASKRRARTAGVKIAAVRRWYIHKRDGWTCHICGDPVNKAAKVPALDAPVLDHVIALARGGAHSEENLRTAHFYCNSVKRELTLSELT